jgi:hypothetical protein
MFFKKKKQETDKRFIVFLSLVLLTAVLSGSFYLFDRFSNESEVGLTTDKRVYREGDSVKIFFTNNRDTPIYFEKNIGVTDRVWDIQIMENGEWLESKEPIFGKTGIYVLENLNISKDGKCFVTSSVFNKNLEVSKLLPNEQTVLEWGRTGCLVASSNDDTYLKRAVKGTYRISLKYSYDVIGEGGDVISQKETVYSRPFYLK